MDRIYPWYSPNIERTYRMPTYHRARATAPSRDGVSVVDNLKLFSMASYKRESLDRAHRPSHSHGSPSPLILAVEVHAKSELQSA